MIKSKSMACKTFAMSSFDWGKSRIERITGENPLFRKCDAMRSIVTMLPHFVSPSRR
jgi:hypothetical protein